MSKPSVPFPLLRVSVAAVATLFALGMPGSDATAAKPKKKPGATTTPTPTTPTIPGGLPGGPGVGPTNLPQVQPIDFGADNWGFEHGLAGWAKTGDAFDAQPTFSDNVQAHRVMNGSTRYAMPLGGDYWTHVAFPVGHKGMHWIGTYEARDTNAKAAGTIQGDAKTGTLTSTSFKIEKNFITFLVGGGRDLAKLKVELLVAQPNGSFAVVSGTARTGQNHELLRREWWDVSTLKGKSARIRITDNHSGGWGHINVDDFRFVDKSPSDTILTMGGVFPEAAMTEFRVGDPQAKGYVDWDSPVFGVADLHTHPAAHLGFGTKVMHGSPDGSLAKQMGNCNATHGGWGTDNTGGNHLRAIIVGMLDGIYMYRGGIESLMDHPHDGYPEFKHWPTFTTVTHQQMRYEWIKRAHEGGLQVMVGLAVNNHLLAAGVDGDGSLDDRASANAQITFMKRFVRNHSDFMGIANDPAELRRIVRSGKLAVILGVEVDNIGNFNFLTGVDKSDEGIRKEIRRLHRQGVRYAFPVHVTDNAFGGAAIYSELFNLANRFAAVQPLPPDIGAWAPGTAYTIEHAPDPDVNYRLAPVIPGVGAVGILGLVMAIENAPSPVLGIPLGAFMNAEPEWQVIKNFFLVPDPLTESYGFIKPGHRNTKGLSHKGEVAVAEMMKLGMMIDIDHASERAVADIMAMAEAIPDGYPLMSGHNGFRPMRAHASENQRSDQQVRRIMTLGGMMGIGWGYGKDEGNDPTFSTVIAKRGGKAWTNSNVAATCGGSSRRFAQEYLYGLEQMGGSFVGLGSDINGMFPGPGPRFGAFAKYDGNKCGAQAQPVAYKGGALTTHAEHGSLSAGMRSQLSASSNAPLSRLKSGNREWDINLDGVAHYGLLPDFLQDLDNVGVTPQDLTPLFHSAEHFARSWQKSLLRAPGSAATAGTEGTAAPPAPVAPKARKSKARARARRKD